MMTTRQYTGIALASAAALALSIGMSSPSAAADLGGNCCADLEERIAELEATTVRKGNRKVSLQISGWLNKTILFWDDGVRSDVYAGIDNDAAQSRWRFTGMAKVTPDITAGFVYEFGGHGSLTSHVDQSNGGDDGGFGQRLRQANVWLESKRVGKFTIGFASQATDGIAEIDLSRTEVVSGSGVNSWNSSFRTSFRLPTLGLGPFYFFPMIEHFGGNFDGGRDQLIRWDSPTVGGFQIAASVVARTEHYLSPANAIPPTGPSYTEWDVALRYAAEFNGLRFAAGIGYHHGIIRDSDANPISLVGGACGIPPIPGCGATVATAFNWEVPVNTVTGSMALLHVPSGFFFTGAAGRVTFEDTAFEGDKYWYLYAKAGKLMNLFPVGQTSVYGEYYQYNYEFGGGGYDFLATSFRTHMWGVGIVQHIDAAAMELYLAYRFYDAPTINFGGLLPVEFSDMHMIQAGARIRF